MSVATDMQQALADAISDFGHASARTVQSREGRLGPSDLGFCRNKAALMTKGVEQTDETPITAAQIGTAIHAYLAEAFTWANPDNWLVEQEVTATFPSGVEISGTADLILTDWNALIDAKTVDGFEWVKREGSSQNHKFQRHTYALGAIAGGLLDESKTIYVGNLYIDRSGKQTEPLLLIEEFDPTLTLEIDSWIGDVIYAVKNDEDASRDIPAPVCEKICEHFTVCRGGLEVSEGGDMIEDTVRIEALRMYVEARDNEKVASQQKKEAQSILYGTNGTGIVEGVPYSVRWTYINPTNVNAFERPGYDRMDIRKARK